MSKIGDKSGRLTVKTDAFSIKYGRQNERFVIVRCDCGILKSVLEMTIDRQRVKSCGCLRKEKGPQEFKPRKRYPKGITSHPLCNIWKSIKNRCLNPNYGGYIGDKFSMFEEWKTDYEIFYNWGISNGWFDGCHMTRKDENKDFVPDNCVFVNNKELYRDRANVEKRKKTNLERYGVESYNSTDECKDRVKKTNLEKFGGVAPACSPNIVEKSKQTSLNKYGQSHFSKTLEFKELSQNRCLEKFGFKFATQNPEIKEKLKQKSIERGHTLIYDGKTIDEIAKELSLSKTTVAVRIKKFGYETAIKIPKYQSNIEHSVEIILNSLNVDWDSQLKINGCLSDFSVDEFKLIIECNGVYFHSDKIQKDNLYHYNRFNKYLSADYSPLFFNEDDISCSLNLVYSKIARAMGRLEIVDINKYRLENINNKFLHANLFKVNDYNWGLSCVSNDKILAAITIKEKKNHSIISNMCENQLYSSDALEILLDEIISRTNKNIVCKINRATESGHILKKRKFKLINTFVDWRWVNQKQTHNKSEFKPEDGKAKIWDCGQEIYLYTR